MTEHHDTFKTILDGLSILTVLGTLNEMLPSIASLFTIVWLGFRIWETDTVRGWTGRGTTNAIDE